MPNSSAGIADSAGGANGLAAAATAEGADAVAYHKTAAALSKFSKTGLTDIEDIVPFIRFLVSDGWWMTVDELLEHLADPAWAFVPDGRHCLDLYLSRGYADRTPDAERP